eukprot:TRINITY_DN43003_c0_g1_i1.p1 TRINITY_DN43003_c0_g1~~TRINITY_DN43003_c0_g1_i1.p1  ORF type:complete len:246 (-),score=29.51 TRINITY_DN43003_c0_g1_i1:64-735(-)
MPSLRLYWWDAPGRGAEPARLAFHIGGVAFEDVRVPFTDKKQAQLIRDRSPYCQLPALEIDGHFITQSATILRYAGKLAGLMPEDSLGALKVEEAIDFVTSDLEPAALHVHLQGDDKIAARRLAASDRGSSFHKMLRRLDTAIEALPCDKIHIGDLKIFCETSTLISGFYDGFPTSEGLFEGYPNIRALRSRVVANPAVVEYYAGRSGLYQSFGRVENGAAEM